jgi:hypothetical protein
VLNLAPGEGSQLLLSLSSGAAFVGEVRVTVTSGTDEREVTLPLTAAPLTIPGTGVRPDAFIRVSSGLQCILVAQGMQNACDLSELLPVPSQ